MFLLFNFIFNELITIYVRSFISMSAALVIFTVAVVVFEEVLSRPVRSADVRLTQAYKLTQLCSKIQLEKF